MVKGVIYRTAGFRLKNVESNTQYMTEAGRARSRR